MQLTTFKISRSIVYFDIDVAIGGRGYRSLPDGGNNFQSSALRVRFITDGSNIRDCTAFFSLLASIVVYYNVRIDN